MCSSSFLEVDLTCQLREPRVLVGDIDSVGTRDTLWLRGWDTENEGPRLSCDGEKPVATPSDHVMERGPMGSWDFSWQIFTPNSKPARENDNCAFQLKPSFGNLKESFLRVLLTNQLYFFFFLQLVILFNVAKHCNFLKQDLILQIDV